MGLTSRQTSVLLVSILVVALCGIVYELIIAAIGSYLLGNSVIQFSLTIGLFMFAMGAGSYLSRHITRDLLLNFIRVEIAISLVGGICSLLLFLTFSYYRPLYQPVMYCLILVIGSLVGIEIPLLTRILSDQSRREFKDALAEVFSLDYLGALIGSIAFPLLILPNLGLVRSSFVIGLLNILIAIINVALFREMLPRARQLLTGSIGIGVGLIVFCFFGTRLTTFVEQRLYADTIIFREQSPYQRIVLSQAYGTKEHRLYIDGHLQFAEKDEYRYHESIVHPVMAIPGEKKRILILGGGDGLVAREVFRWPQVEHVDLVDIDPTITKVCDELAPIRKLNEGALSNPKISLHHTDAFSFVRDVTTPYHRIIIDLPDPHNEALNKLYSREFYRMVKHALGDDGYLACQSASPFQTRDAYWCIAASMQSAGLETIPYHCAIPSFGIWGFHLAGKHDFTLDNIEPFPKNLRYLNPDVLRSSQVFSDDIAQVETEPNTIGSPHLYHLYLRNSRQ